MYSYENYVTVVQTNAIGFSTNWLYQSFSLVRLNWSKQVLQICNYTQIPIKHKYQIHGYGYIYSVDYLKFQHPNYLAPLEVLIVLKFWQASQIFKVKFPIFGSLRFSHARCIGY